MTKRRTCAARLPPCAATACSTQKGGVDDAEADGAEAEVAAVLGEVCDEVETRGLEYDVPANTYAVAWDTETTGLNGAIVQIGVVFVDAAGNEIASDSRLLAPLPGFPTQARALAIHKITPERQKREGEPVSKCLLAFKRLVQSLKRRNIPLVAHNASFDERILRNTASAAGCDVPCPESLCTMTLGKTIYVDANGKNKSPKNRDLYNLLIGGAPEDAQLHDAVEDARLTARSFVEGRRVGHW